MQSTEFGRAMEFVAIDGDREGELTERGREGNWEGEAGSWGVGGRLSRRNFGRSRGGKLRRNPGRKGWREDGGEDERES